MASMRHAVGSFGGRRSAVSAFLVGALSLLVVAGTTLADDAVRVLLTGPRVAAVGQNVSFEVELVNRSGQPLSQLRVIDYFDKGLRHPASASPIEQKGTIDLAAGTSRRLTLEFQLVELGQQCHRVEILDQANQAVGGATVCVEAVPPNSPAAVAAQQGTGGEPPRGSQPAGGSGSLAPNPGQPVPTGPVAGSPSLPAVGQQPGGFSPAAGQPPAAVTAVIPGGAPRGVTVPPLPSAGQAVPWQDPAGQGRAGSVSGGPTPAPERTPPNVATLSVAPQLSAAFEVAISGPAEVPAGETAEFVVVVKNIGSTAASEATLEVNWDVPLTPLEASDGYTLGRGDARWAIPAIAAGETVRRQINFRGIAAAGTFTDSPGTRACVRTVLSGLPGGNMVADEACLVIRSQAARPQSLREASIRLSLADLDDPVRLGSGTTLICTVINDGERPSGSLDLLIQLPPQARLVGNPIPSRVRIDGSRVAFDGIGSLSPGGRSTFELVYRMPAGEAGQASAILSGNDLDGTLEATCKTTFLDP